MSEENPHRRELEAWRDQYAKRRGLVRDMLYEAAPLVRDAVEWAEKDAAGKVTLAEERCAGRVEQAQREADRQREECEGARRHARTLQKMLDDKRALNDERQRDGEEVRVTIGRDHKGWQLADLEEVAYRLRLGGAVDDTAIKVGEYSISGNVPDPNMVSLAKPERTKPVLPDTYAKDSTLHADHRPMRIRPAVVTVILAVLSILAGVVLGAVVL